MRIAARIAFGWLALGIFLALAPAAPRTLGATAAPAIPATPATLPTPGSNLQTKYYDLRYDGVDGPDLGRMLDALHEQLAAYFGKAPPGRLHIEIFATEKDYQAALRQDGLKVPGSGGYYSPSSKTAYLFRQPSAYHTRHLTLHEATHQFHYLVATGNQSPSVGWYTEGLAEYFGCHNWDGKTLTTGIVPQLTLEDRPAAALQQLDAAKWDLAGIISGKVKVDRPIGWALVHFLLGQSAGAFGGRFRALAAKLDAHADAGRAWAEVYGPVTQDLSDHLRSWLETHQQAWDIVWINWQERGAFLEGQADTVGLAVLKATPASVKVELHPGEGYQKAGLVFGYQSAQEFHLFQVWGGDQVNLLHRHDGQWERMLRTPLAKAAPAPAPGNPGANPGAATLALRRDGDAVTLVANGQKVKTMTAPGRVGLSVDHCTTRFKVVE